MKIDYTRFAVDVANDILVSGTQLGGAAEPRCVTLSREPMKAWTTVVLYDNGEKPLTQDIPATPLENLPRRLDLSSWTWLDRLTQLTAEARYATAVDEMVLVFEDYGFDTRSGLGYLGYEADLDVVSLGPNAPGDDAIPRFKPIGELPLERLHRQTPEKLHRMLQAVYWGLVLDEATFDYNRYCYYGFRDTNRLPAMTFDSSWVAFAQSGAWLVDWWVFDFLTTGNTDSLGWARRMVDKYDAVQFPTGLVPHYFGGLPGEDRMSPREQSNSGDGLVLASWLQTAKRLRAANEQSDLAEQLESIARKLAHGLAEHHYLPDRRTFPVWVKGLTGNVDLERIVYAFPTQELKEYWLQKPDPSQNLDLVEVYSADGFYSRRQIFTTCGVSLVMHLAEAAEQLRDDDLATQVDTMLATAVMERVSLTGAKNEQGQWTFPATGYYVRAALALFRFTGEPRYQTIAHELGATEIRALLSYQAETPEDQWWRLPARNEFISAVLDLADDQKLGENLPN